jgi:heat shock protein HslJ
LSLANVLFSFISSLKIKTKFMRKIKSILRGSSLLFVAAIVTLSSCTKDAQNPNGGGATGTGGTGGGKSGGGGGTIVPSPTGTPTTLPVEDVVTSGTWKVTSYVEKNESFTKQFANYTFTFNTDGTLTAKDGGNSFTGYWRSQRAIFYYGLPVTEYTSDGFVISIGDNATLSLLTKEYFISFKGLSTVSLTSINPQDDAHVTFSK